MFASFALQTPRGAILWRTGGVSFNRWASLFLVSIATIIAEPCEPMRMVHAQRRLLSEKRGRLIAQCFER
jgi:hypothetical protein